VNPHASLEELRAEAEREPGRMHGRVQAVERAAEEERGRTAGAYLVSRCGADFLGRAELGRGPDFVLPGSDL